MEEYDLESSANSICKKRAYANLSSFNANNPSKIIASNGNELQEVTRMFIICFEFIHHSLSSS